MSITYEAAVLEQLKKDIVLRDLEINLEKGNKAISIQYAALNHRDYWITQGLYPGIELPVVMGSDGSGTVDGKNVLINPNKFWGDNENFPSNQYEILGLQTEGTFAEYVEVSNDKIHLIPEHMNMQEAAALPLAGMTAFRATFTKGKLQPGQNLLVTGIGGGVSQMAALYGIAIGANVYVSSSSEEKIEKAKELGATDGINYKNEDWDKDCKKQFGRMDVIVDGAGGKDFDKLISVCNKGARIVNYGGTAGKIGSFNPAHIFFKQLTILGSTMASDSEFADMLAFVTKYKIRPQIDRVFTLSQINEALTYMKSGNHFGKILLSTAK